jgi:serine/threonine-protein kinase
MGEVRLCEDRRVGREVALKVMRADAAAGPDATARFLREARIQGQLEHPAIVPVHDLGVGEGGAPYFTMKRLRGMTLEQILAGQRAGDARLVEQHSRRKLLTQFASVCQAVEFAHSRGVVHRDLKPCNIMLGDFGEVYVLDWGVAKLLDAGPDGAADPVAPVAGAGQPTTGRAAGSAPDTAYGAVLGTPGYMAPEQLRGETDKVDARADVYALGAILFEVLTLAPLHEGASSSSIIESTLAGADARAVTRVPHRDVPPELEAICVRATAPAREDRYGAVRELHADLERYLDGDRDLERRRQAAAIHAAAAELAAQRALADDDADARRVAMGEAGRALALDPAHRGALELVTRLLVSPPRAAPPEVERAVHESMSASSRVEARAAMWSYLTYFLFAPLFLWLGVRDCWLLIALGALVVLGTGCAWVLSRRPSPGVVLVAIALNAIFMALLTRSFGPFMIVPSLAAVTTLTFVLHVHLQRLWLTIGIGCAAVVAPAVLEWVGVLSPTVGFRDGALELLPNMVAFSRTPVMATLILSSVGTIVVAALLIHYLRVAQIDAERRMHMQSWQFRQLVPAEAQGAVALPTVEAPASQCSVCPITGRAAAP